MAKCRVCKTELDVGDGDDGRCLDCQAEDLPEFGPDSDEVDLEDAGLDVFEED